MAQKPMLRGNSLRVRCARKEREESGGLWVGGAIGNRGSPAVSLGDFFPQRTIAVVTGYQFRSSEL
jgi:hypothetical protein